MLGACLAGGRECLLCVLVGGGYLEVQDEPPGGTEVMG